MPTLYEQWAMERGLAPQSSGGAYTTGSTKAPQKSKKGSGNKSWISSIISEVGGAGGAAGGAAAGAALGSVVPGLGTLVGGVAGGIIGGFGGGTAGRLAENKWRDNEYRLGDALKEGAVSGALSGAGGAFQAVRGARAAGGLKAALSGGDDAARVGARGITSEADDLARWSKMGQISPNDVSMYNLNKAAINPARGVAAVGAVPKGNLATRAGGSLRQNVVNPKTNASVFGAAEDKAITDTVNKYVKGLSASGKYKNLGGAVTSISDDISKELAKVTDKTTVTDLARKITANLGDDIRYVPGDAAYEQELKRALTKLSSLSSSDGILSADDVFKYKQYLGSQLKSAFGKSGTDLTVPQQVRMAVWENMDNAITDLAPNVKNLTVAQSQLIQSAKGLQQAANKTAGVPILGLKSKGLESGLQGVQEVTGRALQGAGGLGARATGLASGPIAKPVISQLKRQSPGSLYRAASGTPPEDPNAILGAPGFAEEEQQDFTLGNDSFTATESFTEAPKQSVYSLEQAIADIQRDPGNASDYMKYYDFVSEAEAAQGVGTGKPLNSTAAGIVSDIQNGIANIRALGPQYEESGANSPLTAWFRGRNPYDTEAQSLQANTARIKQIIGKALEGGVLRKEDEIKYAKILPKLSDTDAVAKNKIKELTDDLERKLYLYQQNLGGGGGGADLNSILSQYSQGGYQ